MTSPAWGLTQGGGFQNALATGFQMGSQQRERQEQSEYRNALMGQRQQELDYKISESQREAQAEARQAEIQRRAAAGDPEATAELAGINFGAWRGLQDDQRAVAKERSGVLANAAMDVLNRPPEQRAAAWDAHIEQLSQTMPELARYRGQYNEQSARSVVAQAEMIGKLHEMEQPDYMAIPAGGTLVDTRNPQAVQQFGQARQTKQIGGQSYFQDENGDWYLDDGGPASAPGGFPAGY